MNWKRHMAAGRGEPAEDRRMLTRAEARACYDRIGCWQDRQGWYEDAALARLLAHGDFGQTRRVLEVGCGTGRLAARLLHGHMPAEARYLGLEQSPVMAGLTAARLAPWRARADVAMASVPPLPVRDGAVSHVLATYVLDLLPRVEVTVLLAEAHRVLAPGGLLCVAGLAPAEAGLGRLVTALWRGIHRLNPRWVGGCRPLAVAPLLATPAWRLRHRTLVRAWGITSEVVVTERL